MERDEELNQYRKTLALQLEGQQRLRAEADPETLRIFVNHRCVGAMDCEGGRTAFVSSFEGEEIALLEVRTDSGVLVGSVSGMEAHERTSQIRVGSRHNMVLVLKNHGNRGTVTVSYQPTAVKIPAWARLAAASRSWMTDRVRRTRQTISEVSWAMRVSLALQAAVALGLVFLLLSPQGRPFPGALDPGMSDEARSVHQQLTGVTKQVEAMARAQQTLHEKIQTFDKQTEEYAIEIERRVQKRLLTELQKATSELIQVRVQIQGLTEAEEALRKDLVATKGQSRELEVALKQQAEALSRMKLIPSADGPQSYQKPSSFLPSAQTEEPPKSAGAGQPGESNPLTFWVTFQEGTPESHVQEFFNQIRGRKITGPTASGWINVEAPLKKSETIEGFFETIKKAKIVRALTTSLTGQ